MNIDLKCKIEEDIGRDLNKLHKSKYEYIAAVNLEMKRDNGPDGQKQTELQTPSNPLFPAEEMERIWGKNSFRVFISHKSQSEVKDVIKELKDQLMVFGISCFLAHENIQPSAEWELEIEKALFSMDALLAFMTESFHESDWTDQELGFALARRVPIIPINHGRKPYGFIGKYQAITYKEDLAIEIAKTFLQKEETKDKIMNSYISAVKNCPHYDHGNKLAKLLPEIKKLDEKGIFELISAYNENSQISGSYGFNGENNKLYGNGLLHYIFQWTGKKYMFNSAGKIVPIQ